MEQLFTLIQNEKDIKRSPYNNRGYSRPIYETPRDKDKERTSTIPIEQYLLVTDFPCELYPKIVKEFESFGEIKEIISFNGANWLLMSYENPENAKIAKTHHNPSHIDPYTKIRKYNTSILTEEEKNEFLKINLESREEEESFERYSGNQGGYTKGTIPRYNIPSSAYLSLQPQKTNLQKFLEVFFNI